MYSKYDFLSVQGPSFKIQQQRPFGHFCALPCLDFSLQIAFLDPFIYLEKMEPPGSHLPPGPCPSALQFPQRVEDLSPEVKPLVLSFPSPRGPSLSILEHMQSFLAGSIPARNVVQQAERPRHPRAHHSTVGSLTLFSFLLVLFPGQFTHSSRHGLNVTTAAEMSCLMPWTRTDVPPKHAYKPLCSTNHNSQLTII